MNLPRTILLTSLALIMVGPSLCLGETIPSDVIIDGLFAFDDRDGQSYADGDVIQNGTIYTKIGGVDIITSYMDEAVDSGINPLYGALLEYGDGFGGTGIVTAASSP